MTKKGPDFYDIESVFDIYSQHRSNAASPNETMEQPVLWSLIGNPVDLNVLDLGCGDARVAKKFRSHGARNYVGIEGSKRMVAAARDNLEQGFSTIKTESMELTELSVNSFDLVVSSLAIHYVNDLSRLFRQVQICLRENGRFVFSVEHPVITSCNKSVENSPVRQAWFVDDYFKRGERHVQWMGDSVIKYHRTIEDFLHLLSEAGLTFQSLREADPSRLSFADEELRQRRTRIPLFLIIEAKKL